MNILIPVDEGNAGGVAIISVSEKEMSAWRQQAVALIKLGGEELIFSASVWYVGDLDELTEMLELHLSAPIMDDDIRPLLTWAEQPREKRSKPFVVLPESFDDVEIDPEHEDGPFGLTLTHCERVIQTGPVNTPYIYWKFATDDGSSETEGFKLTELWFEHEKRYPKRYMRVNLAAITRVECSKLVLVPANWTQEHIELHDLVKNVECEVDGSEYTDDAEFWERSDSCHVDTFPDVGEDDRPDFVVTEEGEVVSIPR